MNKTPSPPKLPLRFFRWYCHPEYQEDIEGDLLERFESRLEMKGIRAAKWGLFMDVIRLFRPGIIRSLEGSQRLNHYGMFKNYFKITWRSLLKQKLYSVINVGGLAVGLASFITILLYVQHELSYDRFYENADRIYRIYQRQAGNVYLGSDYFAVTPPALASVMLEEYPEVVRATSIDDQKALLGHEEDHFWEKGLWADPQFFSVFAFPFIEGSPKKALEKPKSIVLTKSLAKKIFGNKDPMGQEIIFQNGDPYLVTGIIYDVPENSSLRFSFVTSILSNRFYQEVMSRPKWNNNSVHTFLMLAKGADPLALQGKLKALLEKYRDTEGYPFKDTYFVQALSKLHLQSNMNFDIGIKGNAKYVHLFSAIALIVLLLACVNYMNLAIARSINRTREVGLRKVIGAHRWQLIGQFLGESMLIAFLALVLALGLTGLVLPTFGRFMERPLSFDLLENTLLLPGLLLLVIIVGLLSGSYPAFFMSALKPAVVLKGKSEGRLSRFKMQRLLIIAQYAVSIILVAGSLVIYLQLQFIQQKELGYDKEHVVVVRIGDSSLRNKLENLKNEWLQNPKVKTITVSNELPTNISSSTIINDEDSSGREDDLAIYEGRVDYDYLNVFGLELVAGRNFSQEIKSDLEEGYLINETAAKALGWTPQEAVGRQFTHEGVETVIGVVKDFHMHSMHLPIQPLMLRLYKNYIEFISVKVLTGDLENTLAFLEGTWKKHSPYPFEYQFLDEHFDQLYKSEMRLGETFGFFTVLSLLIASLGLFGLAAFTAERRTKEIGIRKVLGATVRHIVGLLSKDFLMLVTISFTLAIPIAWYAMDQWLQDFAYRIEIEWWMFVLVGIAVVIISFVTVSAQSIKAALTNPVDTLRDE